MRNTKNESSLTEEKLTMHEGNVLDAREKVGHEKHIDNQENSSMYKDLEKGNDGNGTLFMNLLHTMSRRSVGGRLPGKMNYGLPQYPHNPCKQGNVCNSPSICLLLP